VGHEVDFTIADFVADLRAPTPSAAAELVVKSAFELMDRIGVFFRRLENGVLKFLRFEQQKARALQQRLQDPKKKLQDLIQRNDDLLSRLSLALENGLRHRLKDVQLHHGRLVNPQVAIRAKTAQLRWSEQRLAVAVHALHEKRHAQLAQNMAVLDSLSPLRVVDRGYSIVSQNEKIIKSAAEIQPGDTVTLRFAHGRAEAQIQKILSPEDGLAEK
jgi:exodeoxyribonuclease VII large subunit